MNEHFCIDFCPPNFVLFVSDVILNLIPNT